MQYTELHLHTGYSLLDGLNMPDEYMVRASELGMTHMAITDHGNLCGHREFQREAKEAGITPILGCEMYISPTTLDDRRPVKKRDDNTQAYNHLIVLAQDEVGLKNLNKLSEVAWTAGFYSKPRIDMRVLEQNSEGLIVLSGCLNGLIAKAIANNLPDEADRLTRKFKSIFGERFFMEIQGHNPPEINAGLMHYAKKHGVLPVVTSDCHYAREEDLWVEEAMLILSTKPKMSKTFEFAKSLKMEMLERFNYLWPERKMTFQEYEIFLRSAAQQKELLAKQGIDEQPILNTMEVAKMIGDYPYHEALDLLPKPKNDNPDELLEKKAWAGLAKRGLKGKPEYDARLREELKIIKDKNFSSYFLIIANAINWAHNQDIMTAPGRGSSAGSLVNYALGNTAVDPIKYGLLFFRFMDPERDDYPDIDTDIEDRRRSEVKDYMRRQFKHVASIATFGTWGGKMAVKDAARVFCVPLGEVNRALKGADWVPPADWWVEWGMTEKGRDFIKKYPDVIKLARFMYGRIKTQGMHAGGIVVSKEPIFNYAPMQTAKDASDESGNRIPLVALTMEESERLGLIKMDFLGLKALSILSDARKLILERHGIDIDYEKMEFDDKEVYRTLSEGYTKAVFQAEAMPYTNMLVTMGGVKNFDELAASNALVRPGAMKSTAGKKFIDRKKGIEMITYPHADMQWFTKETYGVVIYQEQVMLTMTELAGMSMKDANKVRKIIGKKRDVSEFEEYKSKFIEGASKKVPKDIAEGLWKDFEAHAGYSFNKSHAVAYSMMSYWTAWLKIHYPIEFMTAVLGQEKDKDSRLDYLIETKRVGVRVKIPDVNSSGVGFEIQKDDKSEFIRMGLGDIKYISGKLAHRLMEHRPYTHYAHLYETVMAKGSGLSSRTLGALNAIGAACFADNPRRGDERENFFEYLAIPAFESRDLPPVIKAQFRDLDEYSEDEAFVVCAMVRGIKTGPGWARLEIVDETGSAGVFTNEFNLIETGQMYVLLIANNSVARYVSVRDLVEGKGGTFEKFLEARDFPDVPEGMVKVISFNSRKTKAGARMADAVFSTGDRQLQPALVFPRQFMSAYSKCKEGAVLDVVFGETQDGAVFVSNIL